MVEYRSPTVVFERELFDSDAFADLSGAAVKILVWFYKKRQMEHGKASKKNDNWTIKNNGQIEFPYKEAARIGITPRVFSTRLRELEAHGFLKQNVKGRGGQRQKAKYILMTDWRKWKAGKDPWAN